MNRSFINAENRITIKSVEPHTPHGAKLSLVIRDSIGNPSPDKILEVIKSYDHPDHEIVGAFIGDILIGMLGIHKANKLITIRHISVLEDFQKQGVGALLLDGLKKCHESCNIIAETDEESLGFYAKSGFSCHKFKGPYGNFRYKCEFDHQV